jgi:hypothetical protein
MTTEFYNKVKREERKEKEPSLEKVERAEHKDTILGLVTLTEKKGVWSSDAGLKITEEKGKIIAAINTGKEDTLQSIVRVFEPSAKLESFSIKDSKAKIKVEVIVKDEDNSMREFIKMVKDGKKEAEFKDVVLKFDDKLGVWNFVTPARRIQLGIDEENNEIWVIEHNTKKSVERVDTKIFNLNGELMTFDSATEHGHTPKIKVRGGPYEKDDEQSRMDEFLSRPNVKLRVQASEQQEFKKYHAS